MHYSARDDITYGEAAISLSRCLLENVRFILTFLIFWPNETRGTTCAPECPIRWPSRSTAQFSRLNSAVDSLASAGGRQSGAAVTMLRRSSAAMCPPAGSVFAIQPGPWPSLLRFVKVWAARPDGAGKSVYQLHYWQCHALVLADAGGLHDLLLGDHRQTAGSVSRPAVWPRAYVPG